MKESEITSSDRIKCRTPAKINLLLHVKGKRSDGYHEIVTLLQMVDLWDELIIEKDDNLELVCKDPGIPSGRENLIYKAASSLKEYSGTREGAMITLEKVIPVAAGLGGGSSDAAATLFYLNILWKLGYTNEKLACVGRELGSDVPFFLNGPTSMGYGRGDELVSLSYLTDCWILLINPGIHVSTAWVYSQVSGVRGQTAEVSNRIPADCNEWLGPFVQTKFELTKKDEHIKIPVPYGFKVKRDQIWLSPFNDLEEVVIKRYPIIEEIKKQMVASGAMCSLMSGSGSTVFGIYVDRSRAEKAYTSWQDSGCRSWLVRVLDTPPYSFINYQT